MKVIKLNLQSLVKNGPNKLFRKKFRQKINFFEKSLTII